MKHAPMFTHAIESFEHGLEHYLEGTDRSRKFALLLVDQAIELFLKEKIIQIGKSIYKSNGSTLNIHEAFTSLKEISIPEQPRIEELHDLRNAIQHKGLTPDPDSTDFYMQIAYSFIKRFLDEEFSIPIDNVVDRHYRALIEGQSIPKMAEVLQINTRASESTDPTAKVIMVYTALVRLVDFLDEKKGGKGGFRQTLRSAASRMNADTSHLRKYIDEIIRARQQAIQEELIISEGDAEAALFAFREILRMIGFNSKV